jgi:hypothetical protein
MPQLYLAIARWQPSTSVLAKVSQQNVTRL